MEGSIKSPWNKKVAAILVTMVRAELNSDKSWKFEHRDDEYIRSIVVDNLTRGRGHWRMFAPVIKDNGQIETPDEIQSRVQSRQEVALRIARSNTRRHNVRCFFIIVYVNLYLCSAMNGDTR